MESQVAIGSITTVAGILGIVISFVIEKSEFDPTAFALSMVSIFIVGIALVLQQPAKPERSRERKRKTSRSTSISKK